MNSKQSRQQGAVSIFIVVFTALLVTVVTASFIQIMMRNQQQASNNDLSQSAYDSAMAGVEDAKRALIRLKNCERAGSTCGGEVSTIRSQLNTQTCTSLQGTGIGVAFNDDGEVKVGDDTRFNQAYTCVKVDMNTPFIEGELTGENDAKVVQLSGISDFNRIRVSWFTKDDLPVVDGVPQDTRTYNAIGKLPAYGETNWPKALPPILRNQLVQFDKGQLELDDLDGESAQTLMLYPIRSDDTGSLSFTLDDRRSGAASLRAASCKENFNGSGVSHLCSRVLELPRTISSSQEAYLQLAAYYNNAHYKVELFMDDDPDPVDFTNVQPVVDSTGRASDLFRRVRARISVQDSIQFPTSALNVSKSFCKDFFITDEAEDYQSDTDGVECDPTNGVAPPEDEEEDEDVEEEEEDEDEETP